MKSTLGGVPVTVHAPQDFDRAEFDAVIAPGGFYGLDVEGLYMTKRGQFDTDWYVRMVQFGTTDEAWVLDVSDPKQLEAVIDTLDDKSITFCSHTKMDALAVYAMWGRKIEDRNVDTHVLARMAAPDDNAKNDLKSLATKYGMPELAESDKELESVFQELYSAWMIEQGETHKGKIKGSAAVRDAYGWANVPSDNPVYILYAGLDAIACRRLAPLLIADGRNPENLVESEMWLNAQATRIVRQGMKVDLEWAQELGERHKEFTDKAEAELLELTGLKAASVKLVPWFAENGCDISVLPETSSGGRSLADGAAERLLEQELPDHTRRAVELKLTHSEHINAVRKVKEILDRVDANGYLHPSLNTIEAVTARMSSSGPNVQNIPKGSDLRKCFIAPPGYTYISADFEQVELRVAAALANETKMLDVIYSGGSLHELTAKSLGLMKPDETKKDNPKGYAVGKLTNFLLAYGGGGNALHTQSMAAGVGIPLYEAQDVVAKFRETYTELQALTNLLKQYEEGIRTVSRRYVPITRNKMGDLRCYATINYLIQSSARDLLVHAWKLLDARYGCADIVALPVHDELLCLVPTDRVEEFSEKLADCMTFDFFGCPIEAEVDVLVDEDGVSRWGM